MGLVRLRELLDEHRDYLAIVVAHLDEARERALADPHLLVMPRDECAVVVDLSSTEWRP